MFDQFLTVHLHKDRVMDDWGHDQENYTNTGWKNYYDYENYVPSEEEIEDYLRKKKQEDWEDYQAENDNDYGEMPF